MNNFKKKQQGVIHEHYKTSKYEDRIRKTYPPNPPKPTHKENNNKNKLKQKL